MEYLHTLLYVVVAGEFGGLLYAIQDNKIVLPSIKYITEEDVFSHKNIKICEGINLGVLSDLLFGVGGGLLIFLVTPGVPDSAENFGMIKLISLAIVGGYSGQVLIKKVADKSMEAMAEKTEKLEKDINNIQEIKDNDQEAYKMFYKIIDGKEIGNEEIRRALKNVSPSVNLRGFTLLDERRKELVFKIIDNRNAPEVNLKSAREKLRLFIPLLEEIINAEEGYDARETNLYLHYHYASLAYLYKDQDNPNWKSALFYTKKAIDIYRKKDSSIPKTYMLNKLICHINMNDKEQAESCFKELWDIPEGIYEIIRSRNIITPGLQDWILEHHRKEIENQFSLNENYSLYKENWSKLFPAQ
jgi:hypothetical protein